MNWRLKPSRMYSNEVMLAGPDERWLGSIRHNTDLPAQTRESVDRLIGAAPALLEALEELYGDGAVAQVRGEAATSRLFALIKPLRGGL